MKDKERLGRWDKKNAMWDPGLDPRKEQNWQNVKEICNLVDSIVPRLIS